MNKMPDENLLVKSPKKEKRVSYSALTLVLLIFILQSGFGMVVNILRNIDTFSKLKTVKNSNKHAKIINYNIRYEMQSFNSAKNLESIARNNLKMAAPGEILLVINKPQPENKKTEQNNKPKEKGIFIKDR